MDLAHVLRDILIVLVAAKLAAEVAERIGVPAVVGEIVAGICIGPSLLGLVGDSDEVLRTLGEIGVILLLLEVGMEMDLAELGKVGRSSLLVATVGVVTPMVLGIGAMEALGADFETSLFVGAALTATSVGITARVFGDLRALATTEARIVLGAAVADDVMGLVVLTVVVRLVTEGSVSLLTVGGIVFFAVAFLVAGGLAGLRLAPPLFGVVERFSRSTGTMVAVALAFTLAFAQLADAAKLAPIVGAFVAGVALSRAEQSERVRRELTPVGHLFIPVFFLQIGIDAEISAFGRADVLRDAGVLLLVAVVGKLVSPIGALGAPGDKVLIGLGMLPRGEVGLIFATLGLQAGVLDDDLYASLLLVVLATTLATPQLLKLRYGRLRASTTRPSVPADAKPPDGGWLVTAEGEVRLRARPPDALALPLALEAAILVGRFRPGSDLLDWLAELPDGPLRWNELTTERLFDVIERGNARSWRFLETTGTLDRALPELAAALRHRGSDPFTIDPIQSHRFPSMERLRALDGDDPIAEELRALDHLDWVLLATLLAEAFEDERDPATKARNTVRRLGLGYDAEAFVSALVADRDLLWSAAHRPGGLSEESVLQLASHLETPERARALYAMSALRSDGRARWELERLRHLHDLVQVALNDPQLTGSDATSVIDLRRRDALAVMNGDRAAAGRVHRAPRAYLLRQPAAAIARHATLLDPVPGRNDARVVVTQAPEGRWFVDVAVRDRPGSLASVTGALAAADISVEDAVVAVWDDGAAVESFRVRVPESPDAATLAAAIQAALASGRLETAPAPEVTATFDRNASPWHTVCEIRSPDRAGLLHAIAAAFFAAGVRVAAANVTIDGDEVVDRFEVTDEKGAKLAPNTEAAVRDQLASGVSAKRRRLGRTLSVR